jgi:2',3'-cyclic-nucleotide 2'-phosphodiesterase (5'-nucleotidase family)
MIKSLNDIGITVACVGNHELDYDLEHVNYLTS